MSSRGSLKAELHDLSYERFLDVMDRKLDKLVQKKVNSIENVSFGAAESAPPPSRGPRGAFKGVEC